MSQINSDMLICVVDVQPMRPNQVFGYPGDGVTLQTYCMGKPSIKVKTVSQVDDIWMLADEYYPGGTVMKEQQVSMADKGMVPYAVNGKWHKYNWCEIAA